MKPINSKRIAHLMGKLTTVGKCARASRMLYKASLECIWPERARRLLALAEACHERRLTLLYHGQGRSVLHLGRMVDLARVAAT